MQDSAIEWTDATWNPVHGCSKVSPGCAHCYAETLSRRYRLTPKPWTPANAEANVLLKPHKLREPLGWKEPRRVFVNSMSDLFHEQVPDEYIAQVFAVMALAHQHTFQVLTKRPERMREFFQAVVEPDVGWLPGSRATWLIRDALHSIDPELLRGSHQYEMYEDPFMVDLPLPNVWLGVSIENRRFVRRADVLRDTPAAVRFISAEPLLGPLVCDGWAADGRGHVADYWWTGGYDGPALDLRGIDWLIVGGESGPGHRPVRAEWVRDLRDAAEHAGTAFFFKQWGGHTPKAGGRELDGRTWDETPTVEVQ